MSNPFPFFDLTRQYTEIKSEVMAKFENLLDRQALVMGDAVVDFEKAIASWIGVKHAITCADGTNALVLALRALGVQPGDEVITPAYSFFASTGAILLVGAKPVLVDIDPKTFNIDAKELSKAVTAKTKVIMPVHLYGQCADMDPVMEIAAKHKVSVLEDFAQSIGARYKTRPAGGIAHAGATSFYPTKNLGAAGEGGMMTTNDDALADKMKLIRLHGMRKRYHHEFLGTNSRMDALQAAYLHIKLPRLSSWMEKRNQIASRYFREMKDLESKGLVLPFVESHNQHVWNQFIVTVPKRDLVREKLQERGVPTEIYYPLTIAEQPPLRPHCAEKGWVHSETAAQTSLALPIFPELKSEEQSRVIEGLKAVLTSL